MRRAIWLFPLVFLIHDLEEMVTMESFLRTHWNQLPIQPAVLRGLTTEEFSLGVALLLAIILMICHLADHQGGRWNKLFTLMVWTLLANAFTHLLQSIYFIGYTPGLITAIGLVLPFSIWLIGTIQEHSLATAIGLWPGLGLGLLVQTPMALAALLFGTWLG